MKVRDSAADGYEVLQDDEVVGSFASIVEAIRYVGDRDARLSLDWGRIIVGGDAAPFDYERSFLGTCVGRILGEPHGPSKGYWFWTISTNHRRWRVHCGQRGRNADKDAAVAELERQFTEYLAETPPYAQANGV
ncbi:hypothetical protein [Mesorhizobium sp. 113-3-9]|uniref:hypothetical protein n=1 Tax=Mesorhizobium sp. 113-3-9 TaxID=2744517 RepID=UPI0019290D1E|nr:hypothetical protein [Mesorhizobium sp. 113-3-9]